ncbi:MAG: chromosome partitioning protein ParB [Arachnia propionica]|nr:MAG: chromosome partitioning protein ParB [Arachnia propionica]
MSARRPGLGRGLGDLFANTEEETTVSQPLADGSTYAELPVAEIEPNPDQPRTVFDEDELAELAASIEEVGVLQPIVVRRAGEGYELIMGERRLRASKQAGREVIPAIIRGTQDTDLLRDALLENLHRANLNPLEEAHAYSQLLDDFSCTIEELSSRIHRSRPQISNTLRLLKLPVAVQRKVAAGTISAGHAKVLLSLADPNEQTALAERIIAEGLSVRSTEELITLGEAAQPMTRTRIPRVASEREQALSRQLSDHFDTRVKVQLGRRKGRITIEFAGEDDLDRLTAMLQQRDESE